jgi:hypothetical protein
MIDPLSSLWGHGTPQRTIISFRPHRIGTPVTLELPFRASKSLALPSLKLSPALTMYTLWEYFSKSSASSSLNISAVCPPEPRTTMILAHDVRGL